MSNEIVDGVVVITDITTLYADVRSHFSPLKFWCEMSLKGVEFQCFIGEKMWLPFADDPKTNEIIRAAKDYDVT